MERFDSLPVQHRDVADSGSQTIGNRKPHRAWTYGAVKVKCRKSRITGCEQYRMGIGQILPEQGDVNTAPAQTRPQLQVLRLRRARNRRIADSIVRILDR